MMYPPAISGNPDAEINNGFGCFRVWLWIFFCLNIPSLFAFPPSGIISLAFYGSGLYALYYKATGWSQAFHVMNIIFWILGNVLMSFLLIIVMLIPSEVHVNNPNGNVSNSPYKTHSAGSTGSNNGQYGSSNSNYNNDVDFSLYEFKTVIIICLLIGTILQNWLNYYFWKQGSKLYSLLKQRDMMMIQQPVIQMRSLPMA